MNVVIDSLSRSGTTVFSSILNSQKDIISFRGSFNECLSLVGWDIDWPKGLAKKNSFFEDKPKIWNNNIPVKSNLLPNFIINYFLTKLRKKYIYIDKNKFFNLDSIYKHNQFQGKNEKDLLKIISKFKHEKSFNPNAFYESLKTISKKKILCLRWNQSLSYYKLWIEREQNKWIFLMRDPVSSAISRKKIFNINLEESIEWYKNYSYLISKINNPEKFLIVKIEDLNEKDVLKNIKEFLNLKKPIKTDELIGTDGQPFRRETSDLKNRLLGKVHDKFDLSVLNKYQETQIYQKTKNLFFKELKYDYLWKDYF